MILHSLIYLIISAVSTQDVSSECDLVQKLWKSFGGNDPQTSDCCEFPGIKCSGSLVTEINWDAKNLIGYIPFEIGTLTNLERLTLSNNNLTGFIPSSLGRLTKIKELFLEKNLLSGPIPVELGLLTNLKRLNLDLKRFCGPIPENLLDLTRHRNTFGDCDQNYYKNLKETEILQAENQPLKTEIFHSVDISHQIKENEATNNTPTRNQPQQSEVSNLNGDQTQNGILDASVAVNQYQKIEITNNLSGNQTQQSIITTSSIAGNQAQKTGVTTSTTTPLKYNYSFDVEMNNASDFKYGYGFEPSETATPQMNDGTSITKLSVLAIIGTN